MMTLIQLATPKCPQCGERARGSIETLRGCAEFIQRADGLFDYNGNTDVWWDEQHTEYNASQQMHLVCHCGHDWYSDVV